MIYTIVKKDEEYFVEARGTTNLVTRDFLEKNLQAYKMVELDLKGSMRARADWQLEGMPAKEGPPTNNLVLEASDKKLEDAKTYYFGKEYCVERSHANPDLYELWVKSKLGYYTFVVHFFEVTSVDTLIREHQRWVKFSKKLKRDTYLDGLVSNKQGGLDSCEEN